MPEEIYAYKDGSFKEVKFVHIKQNNLWKLVNQIYIRTGNDWKRSYVAWVASGGTEATYGGYKYHTFTSNGTFTAAGYRSCELLLIGGGGGGGNSAGGAGGGGGGFQNYTSVDLYTGTYTVTVGDGGAAETAGGVSSIVLGSQVIKTVTGGGAGGSGIVIVRYLTYAASGRTVTGGTSTPFQDYTVRTFTSSGSLVIA